MTADVLVTASPGHQQSWNWLRRINRSLPSMNNQGFQSFAPFQWWEMIDDLNRFLWFPPNHSNSLKLRYTHICLQTRPSLVQIMAYRMFSIKLLSEPIFVNWTLGNIFQWNLNQNRTIFLQESAFENVVIKVMTILFQHAQPQYVKWLYSKCNWVISWNINYMFFVNFVIYVGMQIPSCPAKTGHVIEIL